MNKEKVNLKLYNETNKSFDYPSSEELENMHTQIEQNREEQEDLLFEINRETKKFARDLLLAGSLRDERVLLDTATNLAKQYITICKQADIQTENDVQNLYT